MPSWENTFLFYKTYEFFTGNSNSGWLDMSLFWNNCLLRDQYFRI